MEKSFQQSDWSKGVSESETSGGQGYFSKSYAIDIHSVPGTWKAAIAPAKETNTDGFCKFAVNVSRGTATTNQQSLWFSNTGNIYRRAINNAGLVSWGTVYTHSPTVTINGAWEYNDYIYWTSGGSVHRIQLKDAIDGTSWASGSVTLTWGTLNNTEYHPAVIIGTYTLIGNGTTVASIDDTGTITANGIPGVSIAYLPANYEIVSLHKYDIDVLVGTTNKGGVTGAKLLRWDLASPAFTQDIDVPENIVNCFLTTSNRTFLQAGSRGKIYEYTGTSVSPFKTITYSNEDTSTDESKYIFPQSSATWRGIGYFGVSNQNGSSNYSEPGLYALGRKTEKYPISLTHQFACSQQVGSGDSSDRDIVIGAMISSIHSNSSTPYLAFAWGDNTDASPTTYGVDAIHNSVIKKSGAYIETQSVGGNRFLQKTFGNYVIPYKTKPTGTNISLSYYSNFSTSTGSINLTDKSDYNMLISNDKVEAGAMKFKITLTTSGANSPEIEDFYTDWNAKSVI